MQRDQHCTIVNVLEFANRMSPPAPEPAPASSAPAEITDESTTPSFGWTFYAERINGRFAMVGFVSLLLLELLTGEGFFHWLGLR